jgi:hypothetical protein
MERTGELSKERPRNRNLDEDVPRDQHVPRPESVVDRFQQGPKQRRLAIAVSHGRLEYFNRGRDKLAARIMRVSDAIGNESEHGLTPADKVIESKALDEITGEPSDRGVDAVGAREGDHLVRHLDGVPIGKQERACNRKE